MRKRLFVLLMITMLITTSCVSKNNINIGFWTNLSGIQSQYGLIGRNGAELFVAKELSENTTTNFSFNLSVISDDSKSEVAKEEISSLINNNTQVVIAHNSSSRYLSLVDFLEESNLILIGTIISSEKLHQKDDNFFAMIPVVDKQGSTLAQHALNDGLEKVVLVYDEFNASYTKRLVDAYEEMFENNNGVVRKVISFNSSESYDFHELSLSVLAAHPDHVVIASGTIESSMIAQKIKKFDPSMRIYHGLSSMNDAYFWNVGKNTDNIFFVGTYDVNSDDEKMKTFREQYFKEYQAIPTYSACYSYDAMKVVTDVLNNVRSIDQDNIKAYLLNNDFEGLMGTIKFDSYGDIEMEYSIFSIDNGEFRKEGTK